MRYYLIAGEPSGDLHAAQLMSALLRVDAAATFRYYGGNHMMAVGGVCAQHYKDIAYMGFMPVLLHLGTILRARQACKEDILSYQPDAVILVDYADFNLNIAKFIKTTTALTAQPPAVFFYIAPKLWAWKERRIRLFRQYVDELFCILPFEKDFFEQTHHYPVHYVGNPTAMEVKAFKDQYHDTRQQFCAKYNLDNRPIIALLAGSRKQEIKDSLPMMAQVAQAFPSYQFVIAGMASIDRHLYDKHLHGVDIPIVVDATYELLTHSTAALVTSGTATLETCCFDVPQVVMYKTILPRIARLVWDNFFGVKYISLVNLIANKEVVAEMFAEKFTLNAIRSELEQILPGSPQRQEMLQGYALVQEQLGSAVAHDNAAHIMRALLSPHGEGVDIYHRSRDSH